MKRVPVHFAYALLALTLVGCAGLPAGGPQTIEESIAATFLAIEDAADSTADAYELGSITHEEAVKANGYLQRAYNSAVTARMAYNLGNFAEAENGLDKARMTLQITIQLLQALGVEEES